MGTSKFPYLYRGSRRDAAHRGEQELWEKSFRENVCCARAVEKAIRDSAGERNELSEGCAEGVLREYGFMRTMYVLAHTVKTLGPVVHASPETKAWADSIYTCPDTGFGRYYHADTSLPDLERFIGQTLEEYQALALFGKQHCDSSAWSESLEGKVLVLSPNVLKEEYWTQQNQLWLCTGGFGAEPNARGRAVYGICLGDGEQTRWDRQDFIGVLEEAYLPEWAAERLESLRAQNEQENEVHTEASQAMA